MKYLSNERKKYERTAFSEMRKHEIRGKILIFSKCRFEGGSRRETS